jgi:hypothetical protein
MPIAEKITKRGIMKNQGQKLKYLMHKNGSSYPRGGGRAQSSPTITICNWRINTEL